MSDFWRAVIIAAAVGLMFGSWGISIVTFIVAFSVLTLIDGEIDTKEGYWKRRYQSLKRDFNDHFRG